MKNIYKTLIFTFLLILFAQISIGQVQIYVLDFESSGGYTTSMAEQTDNGKDYFIRTNGSDIAGVYNSPVGSYFFAAQDIDADGMSSPATLTIDDVNISGYDNLELRIYIAEDDDGSNQDWDNSDYLHIDYDIDNSGSFTNGIWVENNGDTYNSAPYIDGDYDGDGDGAEITDTFNQFTKSISGTGSTIDIKVTFGGLTSSDEDIAIDHIEIWGTATSSNDNDSQVSASSALSEPATISSLVTSANGIQVFDFTFTDLATSDGVSTIIDQLQITQGSNNGVADWTNAIAGAVLNGPDVTNMAGTVNATNITFSNTGMIDIGDGSNETYTLSIWLNTDLSAVSDNDILEFAMDYNNISTDASGSSFGSGAPESGDNNVAIDIVATELCYATQPSNTGVNNCMSPDVAVEATDANGNRDLDFTENVRITSTGSLVGTPIDVAAVSGLATFSGADCIMHNATGNNFTLNAERTNTLDWDKTSDPFDITNACASELIISEYIEGSSNNKYIELYNNTGSAVDLGNYELRQYNNGSSSVSYTLSLSGTLNDGATYVIENSSESLGVSADLSTSSNVMSFNGDDVIELYNKSTSSSVDIIGKIGEDPGTEWGTGNESTADNTIVRNSDITGGDINGTDAFDPATEWTGYAQDDVSHLGSHTMTCLCNEPTTDAASLTFPVRNATSLDLSWEKGDGTYRIVVCRQGTDVSFIPTDGTTYSANADYSAGSEVGTVGEGNKVVYNGSGSSMTVTGLTPGTTYYFKIFEYNCSPGNEDYYTSGTPAEGNETTLPENVSSFTLTCITNTTATLTWNLPYGNFDGILIAVRESTLPPSDPGSSCDGSSLNSPNTDFSSALVYCGNSTDSRYVYNSTGTSVTITGLTPGADYVFKAFTYNNSDWTSGTQRSAVAQLSEVSSESTLISNQQIRVSWINPTTCYDEIMIVGKNNTVNGAITAVPVGDGSLYTANSVFGTGGSDANLPANEYCVYKGTNTFVDVTALTNGDNYCFKIFVRKGTEWSAGVEVCDTPADITVFKPGDLIFVGYDTKAGKGSGCSTLTARDVFYILTMVDIKPGTTFGLFNASYEYGAAANERTDKFWSCTSTPGEYSPGRISVKWNGVSNISAGSVLELFLHPTDALDSAAVNGVDQKANFVSSGSYCNMAETSPDQMWIYQGTITDYGTSPNIYSVLNGNILFGLSNQASWVSFSDPVNTARTSRVHPDIECFNMDFSGDVPVNHYLTTALHTGSKRTLLGNIMSSGNWTQPANSTCNDVPSSVTTATFTVNAGYPAGTWRGDADSDWFNCSNWEELTVPDADVDVDIKSSTTITNMPKIDHTSIDAHKYNFIAECNNLLIDNQTLTIEGSALDTLFVNGNLTIQNSGTLDMNSGGTNDGLVYIAGNWTNDNATFDAGKGTIIFNGTNTQTITTSATSEIFNNLRLTNNNLTGVIINNNIIINDTLSQNNNLLNLNGNNIEIKGVYENTNSFFEGDPSTNFIISSDTDNGSIDSIYFKNDTTVYDFSIDRAGKSAVLMTSLDIQHNLTITAGNVTLTAGHNYDVDGTLTNNVGTTGLILKSDASGTASLIHNTANIPATCERYLNADDWHYLFSPLDAVNKDVFGEVSWGMSNPNFYWYDETIHDYWNGSTVFNPTGWTDVPVGNLAIDRGYIHQAPEDRVYVLTGGNLYYDSSVPQNIVFNLTNENQAGTVAVPDVPGPGSTDKPWSNYDGWNLIGNPYTAAFSWDDVTLSNVDNGIYFYDGANDNYVFYGSGTMENDGITVNGNGTTDKFIPAGQAFFVKVTDGQTSGTVTIPQSARVHNSHSYWKKSSGKAYTDLLRLEIIKDYFKDETVIRTLPAESNVTDDYDGNYDAFKMFSYNLEKPQIFSRTEYNSRYFALNSFPQFTGQKVIPLGVYVGVTGEYTIKMTENYYSDMHIWLEDVTTGNNINLLNNPEYIFSQASETSHERFYLHLGQNTEPSVNFQIPDQEIGVNEYYDYSIPQEMFTDNDFEDELSISATLENGDELPDWLSFNSDLNEFFGTPSESQVLNIKVTAKDIFGASVFDVYKLTVSENSSINNISENAIGIYPNPAGEIINVLISKNLSEGELILKDVTGKIIYAENIYDGINTISINNLSKGIYIIEIKVGNKKINKKIVKK